MKSDVKIYTSISKSPHFSPHAHSGSNLSSSSTLTFIVVYPPVLTLPITPPLKYSDMWRGTNIGVYFALADEEPQDEPLPTVQETLYTGLEADGQCMATQSSCSCNMVISIEGTDLTDGNYPVTNVTLMVNGNNWHDSGPISETSYTKTVEKVVECDSEFNIEVIATNSIGQTLSATGYVSTARN